MRIAVALAVVALVSGIGTAGLLYLQDGREIEAGIVEELLGVARSAAAALPGERHRAALSSADIQRNSAFRAVREWLRTIKQVNHLSTDVYTVVRSPEGTLTFGIMSNPEPFVGAPYPSWARTDLIQRVFETGQAEGSGTYRDEYGTWLSAFAPVKNASGDVVAVLEVDRRVDDYLLRLQRRMETTFLVALLAALASALIGLIASRRISRPLRLLSEAAENLATGVTSTPPVIRRRDEIGRLSRAFSVMIRSLKERDDEVERLTLGLVAALERANSENDTDTGQHIRRVAAYSRLLAEAAGVDAELSRKIERFAPLHDVGKVGIPDSILKKPGKLTDSEMALMRGHVRVGAEILEAAGVDKVARNICRYHHEWWNGRGYLAGLAGESIPIEARIVAIADVYDALTTIRPYKRAFSHDEAFEIMRRDAGTHFDPMLFQVFAESQREIRNIRDSLQEESEAA
jgi:putative nucleotidyltransferase with HDIG domain